MPISFAALDQASQTVPSKTTDTDSGILVTNSGILVAVS